MGCSKEGGGTNRNGSRRCFTMCRAICCGRATTGLNVKLPGVDRVTWKEYETGLEDRLKDLHGRVHRGAYRALPSKRVYIPKTNGKKRPLGIAALEDKI